MLMFTIARPPVLIGKCLDLKHDGLGRLPSFSGRLNFWTAGNHLLNEAMEIDSVITKCQGTVLSQPVAPQALVRRWHSVG